MTSSPLLKNIRVLDLTNVLSGPFCGYQMALLGADVIKVESPEGGDLARQLGADAGLNRDYLGASFLAQNGGKRSIELNLKKPEDVETFKSLVQTADVVLENFRPGVMDRLGLGYEALKAIKGDIVYCAISGFGKDGPLSGAPAYDQIIQGLSGLMSITGDSESAPLRVGYPLCDTLGGMTAAFAICAALVRRAHSGEGAFVDVSMLDSTLVSMGWIVSNLLIAGQQPTPMGNENFTAAPSGTFTTGDGPINIAANKQQQFEMLCDIIGAPELKSDPRFAERETRKRNRFALKGLIEQQLAGSNAATWEKKFNDAGIPAGQVLSMAQALSQPQVQHRNLFAQVPFAHSGRSELPLARSGFQVDGYATGPATAPPLRGQHSEEILRELAAVADA
ncbi:CoA transferase (plasmid) [Diaphorobacter sp. HDW4B]|uniref:CaiB/BaiF CoA transferase family protein n=1 Tax=Diaphorobacter sp. HDW4B TaxID=2714925 RepID=UPI00140E7B0B|nr:CoA transferase [Diaphorobacter sp. HDW4B]QIL73952.1 CoA transferase [Diaphorobacter sp. HDW4B]